MNLAQHETTPFDQEIIPTSCNWAVVKLEVTLQTTMAAIFELQSMPEAMAPN